MKKFDIIIFICILFSVLYIGYFIVDSAQKQEQNYKRIEAEINKDIKTNMSQEEIHNIIEINCQNIQSVTEYSEVYNCIKRYEYERT